MAINKKLIHFKSKQKFNEELANGNILETSIVFILDTTEIYTHGQLYDGSTFDPSNIEKSIENIINNKANKTEIPTKTSDLTNDKGFITINDVSELTKISYSELKALRDGSQLNEGHLYRITDYVTTTVLSQTKSANHPFDIIVLATSANELSHIARAIQHEGDTYFDGNDLSAWELWYDLDNDTDKYEWADATNGKGVIYRMIDEKRNDCPYDFKNILFYNDKYTESTTTDKYYFTFSYVVSGVLYDGTVEKQVDKCYGNEMGVYIYMKKSLNRNVFRNTGFSSKCNSNTFGSSCYSNTFGSSCYSNTFGNSCYSNTFEDYCYYNTFGNYCYYNTFSDGVENRNINSVKISITLNEEFYDDGKNALVPIKHPDLSTQPSILPYKFMGQYVYEQLIPLTYIAGAWGIRVEKANAIMSVPLSEASILEATMIGLYKKRLIPLTLHKINLPINHSDCAFIETSNPHVDGTPLTYLDWEMMYARIVYTSMPEEGGYYGYNNY